MCNFNIPQLLDLLTVAHIRPIVNQVQVNPQFCQAELVEFCNRIGIRVVASSPLGAGDNRVLQHPTIQGLCVKYRKTPAQIILRWIIDRGLVALPRSANTQRLRENIEIFDFKLTTDEVEAIQQCDNNNRMPCNGLDLKYFFGFYPL